MAKGNYIIRVIAHNPFGGAWTVNWCNVDDVDICVWETNRMWRIDNPGKPQLYYSFEKM